MSAQHTPGPWEVAKGCDQYVAAGGFWVASTMGVRGEEGAANARLIAAAPDLLEALLTKRDYVADAASGALTYPDSGEGFKLMAAEDLARIDAIVAKARGETV